MSISGRLAKLSVGWNVVWGVDFQGNVWYREGIENENVVGTRWVQVSTTGPFKQVSVGRAGQVWALDYMHNVYFRVGACLQCPRGGFWKEVRDRRMSQIDVGKSGVWAVDENKEVFYRTGTYGDYSFEGTGWEKVGPGSVLLEQVSSGGEDMLLGVTRSGEVYLREGMCPNNPTGSDWKRLPGTLSMVDVYGHGVWAIDFRLQPMHTFMWPHSAEPIRLVNATFN